MTAIWRNTILKGSEVVHGVSSDTLEDAVALGNEIVFELEDKFENKIGSDSCRDLDFEFVDLLTNSPMKSANETLFQHEIFKTDNQSCHLLFAATKAGTYKLTAKLSYNAKAFEQFIEIIPQELIVTDTKIELVDRHPDVEYHLEKNVDFRITFLLQILKRFSNAIMLDNNKPFSLNVTENCDGVKISASDYMMSLSNGTEHVLTYWTKFQFTNNYICSYHSLDFLFFIEHEPTNVFLFRHHMKSKSTNELMNKAEVQRREERRRKDEEYREEFVLEYRREREIREQQYGNKLTEEINNTTTEHAKHFVTDMFVVTKFADPHLLDLFKKLSSEEWAEKPKREVQEVYDAKNKEKEEVEENKKITTPLKIKEKDQDNSKIQKEVATTILNFTKQFLTTKLQ